MMPKLFPDALKNSLVWPYAVGVGVGMGALLIVALWAFFQTGQRVRVDPPAGTGPLCDRNAINPDAIALGRKVLSNLDKTQNTSTDYDYWPEGGIRIAYYHVATYASYETIVRLSPVPVFLSGPHGARKLDLGARFTFGHYNPEFIRWCYCNLSETLKHDRFVAETTELFQSNLGKTAMTYWAAYNVLNKHPEELEALLQDYKTRMASRNLPEGYYYNIASEEAEGRFVLLKELDTSYDLNVGAPAVYFWLRRHMDGTHRQVFSILELLLSRYNMIRTEAP
jgi:hypothetical protein